MRSDYTYNAHKTYAHWWNYATDTADDGSFVWVVGECPYCRDDIDALRHLNSRNNARARSWEAFELNMTCPGCDEEIWITCDSDNYDEDATPDD